MRAEAIANEGLVGHPDRIRPIVESLHRLSELAELQPALSEKDMADHPEIMELTGSLDLHWSIVGRDSLEIELRNWILHVLKPSLASLA